MEVINEDDVRTWVAQALASNYILEDLFRTTPEKVTTVESQLVVHKVIVQMMESVNFWTIVEEADAWGRNVASLTRPT